MNTLLRHYCLLSIALLLSACGNPALEHLNNTVPHQPESQSYATQLADRYRDYAYMERRLGHHADAHILAEKGVAALEGDAALLENVPENSPSNEEELRLLGDARIALETYLMTNTQDETPQLLAHGVAAYDCWALRAKRHADWAKPHPCRDDTYTALYALQQASVQTKKALTKQDVVNPDHYMIFFDWDKAKLTSIAVDNMRAIASHINALTPPYSININGHADASGSESYNLRLSEQRARNVADMLKNYGVSEETLSIFAFGETDLLVDTADGVKHPKNRRVELHIE